MPRSLNDLALFNEGLVDAELVGQQIGPQRAEYVPVMCVLSRSTSAPPTTG